MLVEFWLYDISVFFLFVFIWGLNITVGLLTALINIKKLTDAAYHR